MGVDFLPGIVIDGSDWYFVASTHPALDGLGGNTVTQLSKEVFIGNSRNGLDVSKIITVIQRLAHWSVECYWPWFRACLVAEKAKVWMDFQDKMA